jgi:hypothetical protein
MDFVESLRNGLRFESERFLSSGARPPLLFQYPVDYPLV